MSKYMNSKYQSLVPYTPGEQPQNRKYIKLNTNESPYPPSEGVLLAVNREAARDLRLYSDPTAGPRWRSSTASCRRMCSWPMGPMTS